MLFVFDFVCLQPLLNFLVNEQKMYSYFLEFLVKEALGNIAIFFFFRAITHPSRLLPEVCVNSHSSLAIMIPQLCSGQII